MFVLCVFVVCGQKIIPYFLNIYTGIVVDI